MSKHVAIYKVGDALIFRKGTGVNGAFVYLQGQNMYRETYNLDATIYNAKAIIRDIFIIGNFFFTAADIHEYAIHPFLNLLFLQYNEWDKNVHFMFSDLQPRSGIISITVGEAHGNHPVIPPEALKGRNISWMPIIYTSLSGLGLTMIFRSRGLHPRLLIYRRFAADC